MDHIDNKILKYLDIRPPINQPYKMLPPDMESARHFDINITQLVATFNASSPLINHSEPQYLNVTSRIFIFLFCKDFYVTHVLV